MLEVLAGTAELRKPLLEVIGQHWFCKQIGGCALVMETGGFPAQVVPFIDGAVAAAKPRQRDKVNLLILVQRTDE